MPAYGLSLYGGLVAAFDDAANLGDTVKSLVGGSVVAATTFVSPDNLGTKAELTLRMQNAGVGGAILALYAAAKQGEIGYWAIYNLLFSKTYQREVGYGASLAANYRKALAASDRFGEIGVQRFEDWARDPDSCDIDTLFAAVKRIPADLRQRLAALARTGRVPRKILNSMQPIMASALRSDNSQAVSQPYLRASYSCCLLAGEGESLSDAVKELNKLCRTNLQFSTSGQAGRATQAFLAKKYQTIFSIAGGIKDIPIALGRYAYGVPESTQT